MTIKKPLYLALLCAVFSLTLWMSQIRRDQYVLAGRISPQILRFHVIANSNSPKDQEIKLKVKSFLLEKIYQSTAPAPLTKEALKTTLLVQKNTIEQDTEAFIRQLGADYPVSLTLTTCEFPEKIYGNLRLPAGYYETAKLDIGNAQGRNWWCVLYPKLCITKDAVATVPDSSLEELQKLLSPEDFQQLLLQRPELRPNLHASFYLFHLLKGTRDCQDSGTASPPKALSALPGH